MAIDYGFKRLGSALSALGQDIEDEAEQKRLRHSEAYFQKELVALGDSVAAWEPEYLARAESIINTEIERGKGQRKGIYKARYADDWATLRVASLVEARNVHRKAAAARADQVAEQMLENAVTGLEHGVFGAEESRRQLSEGIGALKGITAAQRQGLLENSLRGYDLAVEARETGLEIEEQEDFVQYLSKAFVETDVEALDSIYVAASTTGASADLFDYLREKFEGNPDLPAIMQGVQEIAGNKEKRDRMVALVPFLDKLERDLSTSFAQAEGWEDALARMDELFEKFRGAVGQNHPDIQQALEEEITRLEADYRKGVKDIQLRQQLPQELVDLYKGLIEDRDLEKFIRQVHAMNAAAELPSEQQQKLDNFVTEVVSNPVLWQKQLQNNVLEQGAAFAEFMQQLPEITSYGGIAGVHKQVVDEVEKVMERVQEDLPADMHEVFVPQLAAFRGQLESAMVGKVQDLVGKWSADADVRRGELMTQAVRAGTISAEESARIEAGLPSELGQAAALAVQLGQGFVARETELENESRFFARQPGGYGLAHTTPGMQQAEGMSGAPRAFLAAFTVGPPSNPYGIDPATLLGTGNQVFGEAGWQNDRGGVDVASFAHFSNLYKEVHPERNLKTDLESGNPNNISEVWLAFSRMEEFPQFAKVLGTGLAGSGTNNLYSVLQQATDTLPGFMNLPKYSDIPLERRLDIWEAAEAEAAEYGQEVYLDNRQRADAALGNMLEDVMHGRRAVPTTGQEYVDEVGRKHS